MQYKTYSNLLEGLTNEMLHHDLANLRKSTIKNIQDHNLGKLHSKTITVFYKFKKIDKVQY